LVALAISNRLAFSINGVSIASVVDETLTAGSVGIFVGGDLNEVALEELIVEVPNYRSAGEGSGRSTVLSPLESLRVLPR
jgi:hypothetical protein